jgi:DNA-binding NtrC family response regulator
MSPWALIVDDERLVAKNLQALLEDEGMRVAVTHSAEQAIELLLWGASFDVCGVDLRLRGMDGGLAIPEPHRLAPRLRFLIYTGSASFTVPTAFRDLGVGDVRLIRKPVTHMGDVADTLRAPLGH